MWLFTFFTLICNRQLYACGCFINSCAANSCYFALHSLHEHILPVASFCGAAKAISMKAYNWACATVNNVVFSNKLQQFIVMPGLPVSLCFIFQLATHRQLARDKLCGVQLLGWPVTRSYKNRL